MTTPIDPKSTVQDAQAVPPADTAPERHVRSYVTEVARLIRENKVTEKEVAKANPNIIEGARVLESRGPFVPKVPAGMVDQKPAEPFMSTFTPEQQKATENSESAFDLGGAKGTSTAAATDLLKKSAATTPVASGSTSFTVPAATSKPGAVRGAGPLRPVAKPTPVVAVPAVPTATASAAKSTAQKPASAASAVVSAPAKPVPPPPPPVPKELTEEEKLKAEETQLQGEVAAVKGQRQMLGSQLERIKKEIQENESKLQPLKKQESELGAQEAESRKQERIAATVTEKKEVVKKRWSLEDERQRIERERWSINERIAALEKQVAEAQTEDAKVGAKEKTLAQALMAVQNKEAKLKAQTEKSDISVKLAAIQKSRKDLEGEWKQMNARVSEALAHKQKLVDTQRGLETEITELESKERSAATPAEEHDLETKRWSVDGKLRKVEEEEWKDDEQVSALQKTVAEVEQKSQAILHQEKELLAKLAELEAVIGKGV